LSGCRLCGCVDKLGDSAQCGHQVIEFGRGSDSVTTQRSETEVFGIVGREIRERNATAINLHNRVIAVYGCDLSPGTGSYGVATILRKVSGNGEVGKGGQGLLVGGRDGTIATPAAAPKGVTKRSGSEFGYLNSLVVETPQVDGGISGVARQVVSKRVPPPTAVRGGISDESRGALAL
jgi:hypothetical protein